MEPQLIWATPRQRGFSGGSRAVAGRLNPPTLPATNTYLFPISKTSASGRCSDCKQQEALQKAAELRQMLNSLEKVDDEGRRASLLDTLCATEDVLSMPTYATPPGISSGESTVDLRGFSFVLSTYIAIRSFKL